MDFGKKNTSTKILDTIEDHHNKDTIEDQCCSGLPPWKNCLGVVVFFWCFNKIRGMLILFYIFSV